MPTVLIVDDSAVDRRLVGGLLENTPEMTLAYASDGPEALDLLQRQSVDLVLTDLIMPEMDGLELVQAVTNKYPLIPIILMTSKGGEDIAVQALQEGAASYVPKSALAECLQDTVENVLAVARDQRTHAQVLERMTTHECGFELENDVRLIPPLVSYLHKMVRGVGLCDERNRIHVCVALEEALLNALYHGNLQVDSTLREEDQEAYREMAILRAQQEPYRSRRLHVTARVSRELARFVIRDEGPGFLPDSIPDPTDPANLERVSGRGLLLMRTFMDDVAHNEPGNEVTLIKRATDRSSPNGSPAAGESA